MRIFCDVGHLRHDSGAVADDDTREVDLNVAIGFKLFRELQSRGYVAVLGRGGTLQERCTEANDSKADAFVSIHCNDYDDENPEGIEVWTSPGETEADKLATAIFMQLTQLPGHYYRTDYCDGDPDKESPFYVLQHTDMPAVLIECEFLSNPRQRAWLQHPMGQHAIAVAIADGVDTWAVSHNQPLEG